MLKPALSRGEIQTIGATTLDEYRKYIEKDGALERRFQTIMIDPPSPEDTIKILKGLRSKYEEHHRVRYPDKTIETAVTMAERYLHDRYQPDKSLDVIDETGSRVAAPIWVAYMGRILRDDPREDFPVPDRVVSLLVDEDPSGECVRPVPMAFVRGSEPAAACAGVGQRRAMVPPPPRPLANQPASASAPSLSPPAPPATPAAAPVPAAPPSGRQTP